MLSARQLVDQYMTYLSAHQVQNKLIEACKQCKHSVSFKKEELSESMITTLKKGGYRIHTSDSNSVIVSWG